MLWSILALMLLLAAAIVVWPLARHDKGVSLYAIAALALVIALSAGMYATIGEPGGKSADPQLANVEEMVDGLAARLVDNPEDLAGWKMLGRSYFQLGRYDQAVDAFQRAVDLESASDGQTLVDLGEAIWMQDKDQITGRAGELFENAIAASPNNPKALFYSGMVAAERGERFLAAERWEALLALSPPENIQAILRQRISELRGEEPPAERVPAPRTVTAGPVVSAAVSLAPDAKTAIDPNSTLFIIARDPAQPGPPIAAVRRRVSELPAVVSLGDDDAMIPGRPLSGFAEVEIVARVSMSGQPTKQPGDWYGEKIVRPSETAEISIVIDREVE
jgi:cytochrome c-type biogenesis protein CcmH